MFCQNCGNQQPEGGYCRQCGAPIQAQQQAQGGYGYQQPNYGAPNSQQCTFDGSGGEYFGIYLVNSLLLMVSCGFAYPWVLCRNLKWRKSHTIINGRRLAFTGQPGDLLGKWLVWWLLSLVTCGIYALWLAVRFKEWEMEHTCYEDMGPVDGQVFADSFYDGGVGERYGQQLVCSLLTGLTCGIYQPWAVVRMQKYDCEHSVINGDRLQFNGTGASYWGENSLVGLLNLITCGIYYSWGICAINKWVYKHTFVSSRGNQRRMY